MTAAERNEQLGPLSPIRQSLFDRVATLTISKPTGFFLQLGANALVVRDLRVTFEINKHVGAEPNTCKVSVTNFSADTRAALQTKPLHVRLEAGYAGQVQHLFSGDLRWCSSRRDGADWTTELELGDGERAHQHARVNRSYRAGVDVRTALRETAKAMGLDFPAEAEGLRELAGQFASGLTLSGVASDEMKRLLAPTGLSYSVQDGKLRILSADGTVPGTALRIAQDTGMIGSPEFGSPAVHWRPPPANPREKTSPPSTLSIRRESRKPVLHVQTLLYPTVTPGGRILVDALAVHGLFKVIKVMHSGDTHGQAWTTKIEALPL